MDVCTGILLRMLGAVNRRFPCVRLRGIFLRQFSGLGVQAAQGSTFRVYDFENVSVGVKSRDMVFSGLKFRGFCFFVFDNVPFSVVFVDDGFLLREFRVQGGFGMLMC